MKLTTKVTKCYLLEHAQSEKVCNWYYITYVQIYDEDKPNKYKRLHWITTIDADDVWGWVDDDETLTDKQWEQAREDLLSALNGNVLDDIASCKTIEQLQRIYDWANETVNKYNY